MAENTVKLPKDIFGLEVKNHQLLKLAYDSYLANSRKASATTLQRGEVSGGGKKPWRQKGTGRARFGSSRNPIWRGGGVVFGPRGNENYSIRIPSKTKRLAVRQALSLASKAGKIKVQDINTTGKTKEMVKLLSDNKFTKRSLILVDAKTPEFLRATNNIQSVLLLTARYLSVYHVLNADHILITPKALTALTKWLSEEEK